MKIKSRIKSLIHRICKFILSIDEKESKSTPQYTPEYTKLSAPTNPKDSPWFCFERRTGNTTRIIDWSIQELFTNGECFVVDHYGTREASIYAYNITLSRLKNEHGLQEKDLILNRGKYRIKLKK